MSELIKKTETPGAPEEMELLLVDIARAVVDGRKFIALFTAVVVLVCLGVTLSLAKYKSESLFYFSSSIRPSVNDVAQEGAGLKENAYDRILSSAKTLTRFDAYLAALRLAQTPEVDMLRAAFMSAGGIGKQISPLYFSQFEHNARRNGTQDDGNVLGLKIALSAHDAQLAYRALALLTRYLVDTIVYDVYYDRLVENLNAVSVQEAEIENALIGLQMKRPHLARQIAQLEALIEKYSRLFGSSSPMEMRIATENALGSSPVVKVMALQMELAEMDEQIERLQRKRQQTGVRQAFYGQALSAHQDAKTAESYVAKQPLILQEVFKDQNLDDEAIREVLNTFEIRNQDIKNLYQESLHLVVQPALPTARSIQPGLGLVGAGALLAGLFLAIMIVLCRVWWQKVSAQA